MRYLASRVAIVAGLVYLVLWIGSSLVAVVALAAGNFGIAAFLARPAWALDLPFLGFLGITILGLVLHFMPLFAGRELRHPRVATASVCLAAASVPLSLGAPGLLAFGRGAWLGASLLAVAVVARSLRSGTVGRPPGDHFEGIRAIDRRAAVLLRAAVVYLLVASAGFLLVSPGGRPLVAALAPYGNSVVHLFVLGFVTLSLAGLGLHLLPRFLEVVPSLRLVTAAVVPAVAGPLGVALTQAFGSASSPLRFAFLGFAVALGAAFALLAAVVLRMVRVTQRRRPALGFFAAGFLFLAVGVGMGAVMGIVPGTSPWMSSIHAWISLFGFGGFVVSGITHEILPPYPRRGVGAWVLAARGHFGLATVGLLVTVLAQGLAFAGFPRTSAALGIAGIGLLFGMALSYAAGTIETILAISPPRDGGPSAR